MGFAKGELVAGRFEIVRQIGAGGLAEVFLARDRVTGSEVALKALHSHLLFDQGLKERFRRELAVTRQLDHPGIVRVYDLYEDEGRPFFAMELLKGETLAERLRAGPMAPEEARRIAADVCDALAAAHKKGVVHRDLKPQNIFLHEAGGDKPQTKLVDFGLARAAGWARLTAQSTVMGTPGYAAPEVIAGGGSDPRSDLYSLAATLFEMLTGARAFPSSDPYQALRRQRGASPSPRAINPQVTASMDALVRRGLEADPEQRFSDATQMGKSLVSGRMPEPARVPPAMTAGTFRLVVHANKDTADAKEEKAKLLHTLWLLGLDDGSKTAKRWVQRISLWGSAPLLSGCSRETAQSISQLCAERGIPCVIEQDAPKKKKSFLLRFGTGGSIMVGLTQAMGMLTSAISNPHGAGHGIPPVVMGIAGAGILVTAGWALVLSAVGAPLKNLPPGDPAVRRLLDGIVRRANRLQERQKDAPQAVQYLRDDLVQAAKDLVREAELLGARAAEIPDELAPLTPLPISASRLPANTEAATLIISRKPEERDLLVGHLLEIAAALDEALSASATSKESAQNALSRLQEETVFAKRVIPEIEATLRGEDPAAPLLSLQSVKFVETEKSLQSREMFAAPPGASPVPAGEPKQDPRVRER